MTIDEKSLAEASTSSQSAESSATSDDTAHNGARSIVTWPPSADELDAMEQRLDAGAPASTPDPASPAVEQWPVWLQKQWIASQRRRAWQMAHPPTLARRIFSPSGILIVSLVLLLALVTAGVGAALTSQGAPASGGSTSASGGSSSGSGMTIGGQQSGQSTANVPDATQHYGNQPAKFTLDPDGAKHFTLTAQQVMWQPVKGQKVLAWTLDGTVPGPMIQATAGDHVRITIVNHLPEATTIHWHGLEVPTDNDGVPPIGMQPIEPGQSYTYDFTLQDQDAGTHWYHSHYDDLTQVGGGMYGAFIVAPRPGSPEYQAMAPILNAQVNQTLFIGMLGSYYVINGKSFPDTQPIVVKHGQTVHLSLIGADVIAIHPMHLHGHSFQVVAEDGHMLPAPYIKDTLAVAPGETYDVTFYTWAAPGSVYPLHCHILTHLMNPGQTSGEMGGLITLLEYQK
ncbi:MAG TPA: multicopper oxidase domain-containing protein [Ktedonobacterales bacterium]|jgi:FtsP/CotA-like multicopper oxidase with cupredoxin domain|nr:multicopper oxidase domain-containing protein [Ktedonobacterales bacterium]